MRITKDTQLIFEPNVELKRECLGTRKQERVCGNIKLPGLFSIYNYEKDFFMVLLALLVEISGFLYITFTNLRIIAVSAVFGLILINFILALARYKNSSELKKVENEILVEKDEKNKVRLEKRRKQLTPGFFSKFMIYLFTIAKIGLVFFIFSCDVPVVVAFGVLYLFSAYVHVYHMVFWLNGKSVRSKLKKQYSTRNINPKRFRPIERGETVFSCKNKLNHCSTASYKLLPAVKLEQADVYFIEKNLINKNNIQDLNLLHKLRNKAIVSYREDITDTDYFKKDFEYRDKLQKIIFKNNNTEISVYDFLLNKNEKFYKIYSKGILLDDDVVNIANGQSTSGEKALVAKECLRHQLKMLK